DDDLMGDLVQMTETIGVAHTMILMGTTDLGPKGLTETAALIVGKLDTWLAIAVMNLNRVTTPEAVVLDRLATLVVSVGIELVTAKAIANATIAG
ncbi:hypothetical protein L0F63_006719, partial [Massospora cicadina]